MTDFALSQDAEADMENIYWFTFERWGEAQAVGYVESLFQSFATLSRHPEIGKPRVELRTGIKSFPHKRHIIYYMLLPEGVGIARVLHASMDVEHGDLFRD